MTEESFLSPKERYRLYFDETGNGDLHAAKHNDNERYLSITGVVIRQDINDGYATKRLDRLKKDIFGTDKIVLHRREIISAEGKFSPLQDVHVREEFNWRFFSLISEICATAFTVSIDKRSHLDKYKVWHFSPYHYALTCLAERFVYWLHRTDKRGDMIGEARKEYHDKALRKAYLNFRKNGTSLRSDIIQKCLVSTELSLKEKQANITGLQFADSLAHPCHRSFRREQNKESETIDVGVHLSRLMMRRIYDRHPHNKVVSGYGKKWLP